MFEAIREFSQQTEQSMKVLNSSEAPKHPPPPASLVIYTR